MIKKVLFTLSLASLFCAQANAQRVSPCGTDEIYRQQLAAHPEIAAINEQLSKEISEKLAKTDISRYAKTTDDGNTEYIVPLVFHVIHDYGDEYVTDAAIVNCVKKINEMYNKRNADTADAILPFKGLIPNTNKRYIGNAKITWYLATKDPLGNPTNGITRRRSYLTSWGTDLAKYDQWPSQNYMNIWLIKAFKPRPDGFSPAAYAYKPATGAIIPYYDGVIGLSDTRYLSEVDYTYSHELGHELNLDHPWGSDNNPEVACGDDEVDDTPPTKGHLSCSGTVVPGSKAPALYDTACIYNKDVKAGKLRLDSIKRAVTPFTVAIFSDTSTSKGIEFQNRTTSSLDSFVFYPTDTVGSKYKIGLSRNGILIDSVTVTTTVVNKPQNVVSGFKIPGADKSTTFKLFFMENHGALRDTVTIGISGYPRGLEGTILLKNTTSDNYYNFFYDWRITYGYFKIYGDSLVNYPDTTNTQNVMDYSYCSKMFTYGQTVRMRAALTSSVAHRDSLFTPTNLERTGYSITPNLAPKAEYSVEKGQRGISLPTNDLSYFLCADIGLTTQYSFVFKNRTWQANADNIEWTLSNGATTPTSTSTGTVITKFATPGWATVTMKASNANGSTTFEALPKVYVADPNAKEPIGFVQDFNDDAENAKWPIFNYYNNRYKWEIIKEGSAGTYDGTAIRYRSYDDRVYPEIINGEARGDYDDFFTPAFDLSKLGANGNINFMYAGAYATTDPAYMTDTLQISYSDDCGATWTRISTMAGPEMQTVGTVSATEYVPGWADWKLKSIDIKNTSGIVRGSRVFFRFRYKPSSRPSAQYMLASGNNFYMDRVFISDNPLTINEAVIGGDKTIAVAPNPTTSNAFVLFKKPNANVKIDVLDITGKLVYSTTQKIDQSNAKVEIPASYISVKGVYLVHILGEDNLVQTEKLIVY